MLMNDTFKGMRKTAIARILNCDGVATKDRDNSTETSTAALASQSCSHSR